MEQDAPSTETQTHGPRFATHFVESVVLTWAGNAARIVIGLVALRLVTGAIPEDALGAYWILTSVAALLSNFADLGLGLGVVRHLPLATDRNAQRRLIQTVLVLRFSVLVLLCGLIAVSKPLLLHIFHAEAIDTMYVYLYAFVVLTNLGEMTTNFLQGMNRFRVIAMIAFGMSLTRLILILVFVRSTALGVSGLFLAEALAMLGSVLVAGFLASPGWRWKPSRDVAEHQLRFGFPLYLNTLLSYTANRINTILIGSMSTTSAVSYFTVANRVPDQLSFILRAYVFVYLPNMTQLLANPDDSQARRLLASSLRLMGFSFALLGLALSLFRHELLAILAPEPYQVAAPAVPLLLGGLAFASLGMIMGHTFVALGDSRTPVRINLWTSLLSFALNWFCIGRWGFIGAAWANFLFNVGGWAITDAVLSRRIRPQGRGYLLILAFLAVLLLLGMNAGIPLRIALLAVGVAGSLGMSRALRTDVAHVWTSQVRRRST